MIDYQLMQEAREFYDLRGYNEIDTPWCVSQEAIEATRFPPGVEMPRTEWGILVGSAEQGFVQLMLDGFLGQGHFMSMSPCFRSEQRYDKLHLPYFMKLELIQYVDGCCDVDLMIKDAFDFFEQHVPVAVCEMGDGSFDIVTKKDGIELGSYGWRSHGDHVWVYGTGIAEPRFSSQCNG